MKILFTGGHITPALAVANYIKVHYPEVALVCIGRKRTNPWAKTVSFEYEEVRKLGIPFYHLKAGRLTRVFTFSAFINFLKIPLGFWQALILVRRIRPDKVLSFGGYLALPVAVAAKILRIPVISHEQTIAPGIASRMIAHLADSMCASFPKTAMVGAKKVVLTGNPVRTAIFDNSAGSLQLPSVKPLIYITGGSLGASSINKLVAEALPELLEVTAVVHQIGDSADYETLCSLKKTLAPELRVKYTPVKHVASGDIGQVYATADLVVGRCGANTFWEMIALAKPALFIPLPWSGRGEQQKQADFFKKLGLGEVMSQEESPQHFVDLIKTMLATIGDYKAVYKKGLDLPPPTDATKKLVSVLLHP